MVLEKDNAIVDFSKLMGTTNPAKAEAGTIRTQFASSIGEHAIHGSDAEDAAAFEIAYFFADYELERIRHKTEKAAGLFRRPSLAHNYFSNSFRSILSPMTL